MQREFRPRTDNFPRVDFTSEAGAVANSTNVLGRIGCLYRTFVLLLLKRHLTVSRLQKLLAAWLEEQFRDGKDI
jgi:hypothetical protein